MIAEAPLLQKPARWAPGRRAHGLMPALDDPYFYAPFLEGGGHRTWEISSRALAAIIPSSAEWAPGERGTGVLLDAASSEKLSFGSVPLVGSGTWNSTLAVVRVDSLTNQNWVWSTGWHDNKYYGWFLMVDTNGQVKFGRGDGNVGFEAHTRYWKTTASLEVGKTYTIAARYYHNPPSGKFWINGAEWASSAGGAGSTAGATAGTRAWVGRNPLYVLDEYFTGGIYLVGTWVGQGWRDEQGVKVTLDPWLLVRPPTFSPACAAVAAAPPTGNPWNYYAQQAG